MTDKPIITTEQYWDCECPDNAQYIHPKTEPKCSTCGMLAEDMPDSRVSEVVAAGLPLDKVTITQPAPQKHTALPWRVRELYNNSHAIYGEGEYDIVFPRTIDDKVNAAFIVKAVNNHYGLLEVIKDIRHVLHTIRGAMEPMDKDTLADEQIKKLTATIEQAEKGPGGCCYCRATTGLTAHRSPSGHDLGKICQPCLKEQMDEANHNELQGGEK